VNYVETNFEHHIFLIGENFFKTKTKKTAHKFSKFEDLKPVLKALDLKNATLLIKGSRGMTLERILEFL
jgi:UDP-N-acetylmuramoyl-tripeptide--D-alanyl-D-alanine ligase